MTEELLLSLGSSCVKPQAPEKLEAQIYAILARIERSVSTFAEEQHEMHMRIKELKPGCLAIRTTAAEIEIAPGEEESQRSAGSKSPESTDDEDDGESTFEISPAELPSRPSLVSARTWSPTSSRPSVVSFAADIEKTEKGAHRNSLVLDWPLSLKLRSEVDAISTEASISFKRRACRDNSKVIHYQSEASEITQSSFFIIMPASPLRTLLDVIAMAVLAWELAVTPMQLAWNLVSDGWLFVVTVLTSSFWTFDILTCFRTGFYTGTGDVESRPKKIASHYMRHQFLIDAMIVSSDWLNILAGVLPSGLKLVRVFKVMRLVRLARMANLTRLERVEDLLNVLAIGPAAVDSIKIAAFTIWLTHITSCVWFAIGAMDSTDTGLHWVDATWSEGGSTFANSNIVFQYCSALQWTLTTMLSGTSAILPLNSLEHLFSCSCIVVGLLFQALVVSILSSSAVEQKARRRNLKVLTLKLRRFVFDHTVSVNRWLVAEKQLKRSFEKSTKAIACLSELEGLQLISSKIRMNILHEVFEPHLSRHFLFSLWSQVDKHTFSKLTNELMDVTYVQLGHDIFMAGDMASGMYLLTNGSAKYVQDPETSRVTFRQSIDVLSHTWICEAALWIEWVHVGTMEADSDECEVHCLFVEGLFTLMESTLMTYKHVLRSYAIQYHQHVTESEPPESPWPTDVEANRMTFIQILTAMHATARKHASFLALDSARNLGLVDAAQSQSLEQEIRQGTATLVFGKVNSRLSLQRVLSIVRVIVSRHDQRQLIELGKWSDGKFILTLRFPGAKQNRSEEMTDAVARITNGLRHVIGDVEFTSADVSGRMHESKNLKVATHVSFFNVHFTSSLSQDNGVERKRIPDVALTTSLQRTVFATRRLSLSYKSSNSLSSGGSIPDFIHDIQIRLRSTRELFPIETDDDNVAQRSRSLCMWLSADEWSFFHTRKGAEILKGALDDVRLENAFSSFENLNSDVVDSDHYQMSSFPEDVENTEKLPHPPSVMPSSMPWTRTPQNSPVRSSALKRARRASQRKTVQFDQFEAGRVDDVATRQQIMS